MEHYAEGGERERALFLAAEEAVGRDVETLKWDRQEESEEEGRQVLVCLHAQTVPRVVDRD
jgi:hypothetical protein